MISCGQFVKSNHSFFFFLFSNPILKFSWWVVKKWLHMEILISATILSSFSCSPILKFTCRRWVVLNNMLIFRGQFVESNHSLFFFLFSNPFLKFRRWVVLNNMLISRGQFVKSNLFFFCSPIRFSNLASQFYEMHVDFTWTVC